MASIKAVPITPEAFAPFGDVLDTRGLSPKTINAGKCKRFDNLAGVDVLDGQVGISMFHAPSCAVCRIRWICWNGIRLARKRLFRARPIRFW